MKEKILSLLSDIKALEGKNLAEHKLPENAYYLNDTDILCYPRTAGDTRYPYEMDGLNLWVHANGCIDVLESNFVLFRPDAQQEEAHVEFWGGVKEGDEWIPVSITGATKPLYEEIEVSRYMVYGKRAAYFIAEIDTCIFALRVNVTTKKQVNFLATVINKTDSPVETYITSLLNPLLRFQNNEDGWGLWNRFGSVDKNGSFKLYRLPNPEGTDNVDLTNYAIINKAIEAKDYTVETTVAMADFLGEQGRTAFNATTLRTGHYVKETDFVNSIGTMIASDIIKLNLAPGEEAKLNYNVNIAHDEDEANAMLGSVSIAEINADLVAQEESDDKMLSSFTINFGKLKGEPVNNVIFNKFLKNVQRQVSFCALGKNYVGELLGVRDVFQQLTATSLWETEKVRKQIVRSLNFIMETGRSPRQFSVPPTDDIIPTFDIRQFIDQGLWVVETLYKYIGITADYSILDEMCSYYKIIDEKKGEYAKSEIVDTVLDHLVKITDYLVSNIDTRTGCLMILYGDWNDSLCGLGESLDGKSEFGTGVSVMATLQLYKLLAEITEILTTVGKYSEKVSEYQKIRENIAESLEKHAKVKDGDRTHLLHGWGDKGAYQVGSLCDTDGKLRYSVNPYSFWCICKMIDRDPSLKKDILKAYDILDSKFGIKTFSEPFTKESTGVGRINILTPGTHENAATYIHATMFAVMALFIIGEPEKAWEQIFKTIPPTHDSVSKTPFVMPNCYFYNETYHLDGQSAGDWYTGSGAVLIRSVIEHALGFQALTDGLMVEVPRYLPSDTVTMTLHIKHCDLTFNYKNTGAGERKYYVNGELCETLFNEVSQMPYILIHNKDIGKEMTIEVID